MASHPPGDGPPPPLRHGAPTEHAGQGDSIGPPHPHARAHSTWVADPNSPPSGRAVGGGGAPDLSCPSQRSKARPPGTPFRHLHSEQRRPARAHAVGPVLGPHARTDRTRNTRVAEPRLPAPEDGRPGEGQRLTPDAPHNSGRPPPPGDGPPQPRRHAGHAGQGDSVGPPHPHTRSHSTWVADADSPPTGRAVEGGGAPDPRRPSQQWKATPPGDTPPPPTQGATPARRGAPCGAGAGSPRPHRPHPGHTGRGTPTACPGGRAVGGGTAPDTRRPSQRWQASPPGDCPPPPPRHAAPTGHAGRGAGAGSPRPHRPHPGHTGRGTPAACPRGRAAGGGTAPDTRRPSQQWQATPPGDGPPQPPRHAGHAGQGDSVGPPHPHTRSHSTWVADADSPPTGGAVEGGGAPDPRRPSQQWKATPPGDAPPPPPQGATPARKGARCGAGAGSPRPHRPHPGHTGPGTPTACPRGRAVGGGTAPDTRRPSQRSQATPPGDYPPPPPRHAAPTGHAGRGTVPGSHTRTPAPTARGWRTPTARSEGGRQGGGQRLTPDAPRNGGRPPPPGAGAPPTPRHAAPTGHAGRGDSAGPPQPHTRAHSTWVVDPDSPPRGRAVGGGGAPDLRRPSQRWKAPPRGRPSATPTASNATPPGRTLWGPCWVPTPAPTVTGDRGRAAGGGTAPDTRGPSQLWQATPPGDGSPALPRHAAPTGRASQGDSAGPPHPHTRAQSTWVAYPDSPPGGRAVGGGGAPDLRRPSQHWKRPPPGTPFCHPHSEQRPPARAQAVGPVLGPHAGTYRTRGTRVAEPQLPAREDGWLGEGQRLTPDAPHNGGRPHPPGDGPPLPPQFAAPTGHAGQGDSAGPPQPPPATPPPHSGQRQPARAHNAGPVLGPQVCTDRTKNTRIAETRLPAPEDGRPGEGQRLTPDAPHNGGRPPPPGAAPHHPRGTQPPQGMRAKGTVLDPHTRTPTPTARG